MNQTAQRITALDFARALAIFGMIVVNYKLAMQAENDGPTWLAAVAGLFEGRASALFVVLAGIGVSLMTAKSRSSLDKDFIRQNRIALCRRAAFLAIAGAGLLLIGWNADILHYYAAFLLLASLLITVSDRMLAVMAAAVVLISSMLLLLFDYSRGWDAGFHVYTDFWTAAGFARNLFFNGFHPLFPWLGFFLIGMWMGRKRWFGQETRGRLLRVSLCAVIGLELLSYALIHWLPTGLDTESAQYLFGTKPMPPNLFYMLSASCSAFAVIAACLYLVERSEGNPLTRVLISTGQLSLSHYIGHVVIGPGLLEAVGYLENGRLSFAVLYSCGYFAAAMIFSAIWRKRQRHGPVELLLRKVG